MPLRVDLKYNNGRSWSRVDRVWSKGFAELDGHVYEGAQLAERIAGADDRLSEVAALLRGEFALVVDHGDRTHSCVVDRIRSIPLFYGAVDGRSCISDDALAVGEVVGVNGPDEVSKLAFLLQGTTLGRQTLLDRVFQARAGEVVRVGPDGALQTPYFELGSRKVELANKTEDELVEMGVAVIEASFARMALTGPAHYTVPLSGGLDSRLVATMLQRSGRADTVCYSYGSRQSFDAATSRRVAERLGLRWEFVPYSHNDWADWTSSSAYQSYRNVASQFCAIEHEQDWPAVSVLRKRKAVPKDSVFVPGHSGDFLAGSHLPRHALNSSTGNPLDWVFEKYLNLWRVDGKRDLPLDDLRLSVQNVLSESESSSEVFDDYGWRHRQAMMIANSVRVYEHHGFDWRLPLWDAQMIEFWSSLPLYYRSNKRLYLKVVRRLVGPVMDIPFVPPERGRLGRWVNRINDGGYGRMGIFAGRGTFSSLRPIATLLRGTDDTVITRTTHAWRNHPILRARINGLLALQQLQSSLARIKTSYTGSAQD